MQLDQELIELIVKKAKYENPRISLNNTKIIILDLKRYLAGENLSLREIYKLLRELAILSLHYILQSYLIF